MTTAPPDTTAAIPLASPPAKAFPALRFYVPLYELVSTGVDTTLACSIYRVCKYRDQTAILFDAVVDETRCKFDDMLIGVVLKLGLSVETTRLHTEYPVKVHFATLPNDIKSKLPNTSAAYGEPAPVLTGNEDLPATGEPTKRASSQTEDKAKIVISVLK